MTTRSPAIPDALDVDVTGDDIALGVRDCTGDCAPAIAFRRAFAAACSRRVPITVLRGGVFVRDAEDGRRIACTAAPAATAAPTASASGRPRSSRASTKASASPPHDSSSCATTPSPSRRWTQAARNPRPHPRGRPAARPGRPRRVPVKAPLAGTLRAGP